jgi:hypothetical protein
MITWIEAKGSGLSNIRDFDKMTVTTHANIGRNLFVDPGTLVAVLFFTIFALGFDPRAHESSRTIGIDSRLRGNEKAIRRHSREGENLTYALSPTTPVTAGASPAVR